MDTEAAVRRWIDTWLQAWPNDDIEALARVYEDDAPYRSHPFRDVDTVRTYLTRAFGEEELVHAWFGEPVVAGDRAAVEYWAVLRGNNGEELTIAGMSMLRFAPDGRVAEHRDCWVESGGRTEPPSGWGR